MRLGMLVQAVLLFAALLAVEAAAAPGSGPHATVNQTFTTKKPNSPAGLGFSGRYHAEGDESRDPPFMRKMTFYPPRGMRYDTSVPEQCKASDIELSMQGPAACPEGSRLGHGTTEGVFFVPFAHGLTIDRYTHNIYIHNNANEQIILVDAEGYAVVRGRFQPDGSIEFASPTCFPTPPTGCVDDHVLQTATTSMVPVYKRTSSDGRRRSYATTPPRCPKSRKWRSRIHFWWADGTEEDVVTTQPCSRRPSRRGG